MKQLKPVIMQATFQITLPQPIDLVSNPQNISVGGFEVVVNGREIPFDFDASSCSVDKISDTEYLCDYQSGEGPFTNDWFISDCYSDDYQELGLSREDITAKFLASSSKICDFFVLCWDENGREVQPSSVCIKSISFSQNRINCFNICKDVISAFNNNR